MQSLILKIFNIRLTILNLELAIPTSVFNNLISAFTILKVVNSTQYLTLWTYLIT